MKNRRLSDQVEILQAISNVRKELKARAARGETGYRISPVMTRLSTLYALLDVERLAQVVTETDKRTSFGKKVA